MSDLPLAGAVLSLALALLLAFSFIRGDRRFAEAGATLGSATGLDAIGSVRVFEQAHTAGNYLLREMIHVVGRKHSRKLRMIAVVAVALPAPILALLPDGLVAMIPAVLFHLIGAFAARWLFFAEAEHVVGTYYGKR